MAFFKNFLSFFEKAFLTALFSILVLLSFTQVVLREFFSTGLLWADVFLRHLVLWVAFLGAAVAASEGKHFAIDIAARKIFSDRAKKIAEIINDIFSLACLIFLISSSLDFLKEERSYPGVLFTVGPLNVLTWWMEVIIPAGFTIVWLHFLIRMVEGIFSFVSPKIPLMRNPSCSPFRKGRNIMRPPLKKGEK